MTNGKILEALNQQLNEEMNSSYVYLAMAADFKEKKWNGFSSWMKVQAEEEMSHVWKFYDYIYNRGGRVTLKPIDEPQAVYEGVKDLFQNTLKHEEYITSCIDNLVILCREEKDLATESFLRWFVDEQVEEEDNVHTILDQIERIGDNPGALFLLDQDLGKRVSSQIADGAT